MSDALLEGICSESSWRDLVEWSDELYVHLSKLYLSPPPFNAVLRQFASQSSEEKRRMKKKNRPKREDAKKTVATSLSSKSCGDEREEEIRPDREKKLRGDQERTEKGIELVGALLECLDVTLQQLQREKR